MEASSSSLRGGRANLRRRVATCAVLLGLVVAAFEGTVVTSAMPTIVRELGGTRSYAWVFSSFLIGSTLAVLVCGKLADEFGRKPVFAFGMLTFLAGSSLCGLSTTFAQLVAFRTLQGIGAGAIQPVAMTISADIYTLEERARIQALFTGAWGAANVIGPVIGGWIVLHASWRWVFLVNVPVGALSAALLVASYRDPPRTRRGPSSSLRSPAVRAGLVAGLFTGAILYTCAAYIPLWMTARRGHDALGAGLALVPLLVGWAVGSSFGVNVLVRRGMRTSVGGGFAIAFAGAAALAAVVTRGLPLSWALASTALLGLGLGPATSSSLVGAQSSVPWNSRGAVTSAVYAARSFGGSLVVAAMGAAGARASDPGAVRFAGVAILAAGAVVASLALAPSAPPRASALLHAPAE